MLLMEGVLQAHGGQERWREKSFFSAHVSISGTLLPPPSVRPPLGTVQVAVDGCRLAVAPRAKSTLRELVMEGDTRRPHVRIYGATDMTRYAVYTPSRTEFRSISGTLLEAQDDPVAAMASRDPECPLVGLEQVLLFGSLVWRAVAEPFTLGLNGRSHELSRDPSYGHAGSARLEITVPDTIDPVTPERRLTIGEEGYIRRAEYELRHFNRQTIAETLSAHACFDGIVVPTLRRLQVVEPGGAIGRVPLIDIEIFDVRFA